MIIGIDASRCRSGGGFSHLKGILSNIDPVKDHFDKVHLWAYPKLLSTIPDKKWLVKHSPSELSKSILHQLYWQAFKLKKELEFTKCDILFTVDASSFCKFFPNVSMSRDMLSYEKGIMNLYGFSLARIRLLVILWLQNSTLKRSTGVIFLTRYAGSIIQEYTGQLKNIEFIPHGVSEQFKNITKDLGFPKNKERPINCLYISNTAYYKNQWHVVEAIELLKVKGYDITLTLVGGGKGTPQKKLEKQINKSDPKREFINQYDFVNQVELPSFLSTADIFIFASSCENMPNTLLEAMAAGLPIACSNRGPMPEVLEDAGLYFDPLIPLSISNAVEKLITNDLLRNELATKAKLLSKKYSWEKTATDTMKFIFQTYHTNKKS